MKNSLVKSGGVKEEIRNCDNRGRDSNGKFIGHMWEYSGIESQIKFLQGNILTIIEAAISDKTQLQALKTIINRSFSDRLRYIWETSMHMDEIDKEYGVGVIAESFPRCECAECLITPHQSGCAVHNEPAYPKGECNCK